MNGATAFRGQPLLVFAGVLCAWIGLRVASWQPFSETAGSAVRGLVEGSKAGPPLSGAGLQGPPRIAAPERTGPVSVAAGPGRAIVPPASVAPQAAPMARAGASRAPMRLAVGHNLLLAAGLSQIALPAPLAGYLRGTGLFAIGVPAAAPFIVAWPRPVPVVGGPRRSADAWLLVRQDTTSSVVSGRPSYGRSQAGGIVRYRLAPSSLHGLQAYLRASSALAGALERDLVAGLSGRPVPRVPLRLAAEARVSQTDAGTELRPAIVAVTELAPQDLPFGLRAEAYLQGGYVAGRFATPFVDGQARLERPVTRSREMEISAGAGAWGGAQKGAARLDVGPTAAIAFRLGEGRGRVAADYRIRVAGDAEPRSGPALTLSAGF